MLKLVIYVNENFEDEKVLFDLENKKVIMRGDHYHNKINERIEGYLQALTDFNIYKDEVEMYWIDESHENYFILNFNSQYS